MAGLLARECPPEAAHGRVVGDGDDTLDGLRDDFLLGFFFGLLDGDEVRFVRITCERCACHRYGKDCPKPEGVDQRHVVFPQAA